MLDRLKLDGTRLDGVISDLRAADNIHLESIFIDGGIFLRIPDSERRVHFLKHAQHGNVNLAQGGSECDAFSYIPQQINSACCYRIVLKGHAGSRFIGIQRVRTDHTKVLTEPGRGQAIQNIHNNRRDASNAKCTVHAFLLEQ